MNSMQVPYRRGNTTNSVHSFTSVVLCSVALNRVPQTQMCKEGGAVSPQPGVPRENSL